MPLALATPYLVPYAKMAGLVIAGLGLMEISNRVEDHMEANPEESLKILTMIMPAEGLMALFNKEAEGDEEVEDETKLSGKEKEKEMSAESQETKGSYQDPEATGSYASKRGRMIKRAEELGLADPDLKDKPYDKSKKYQGYKRFIRGRTGRKADGGRIGFVEGGWADDLTGQALATYNSMKHSHSDEVIQDTLTELGYWSPDGAAEGIASIVNVQPNIIDQGGGVDVGSGSLGTQISDFRAAIPQQIPAVNPADAGWYVATDQEIPIMTEIKEPGKLESFIGSGINKLRESKLGQKVGSTLGRLKDLPGAGIVTGMVDKIDRFDELPQGDQEFITSMMGYSDPDTNRGNVDPFGINTRSLFGNYADYVRKTNQKLAGREFKPGSWQAQRQQFYNIQENERIRQEEAAKKLRLAQEAAALASAQAPSGGQWVGGAPAYTYQGQGGGEYIDRHTGQRDYHDPYDPGGGEKHGGLIGYKDGGLATMFKRKR